MAGKQFRIPEAPGRETEETALDPLDAYFDSLPDDVLPENEQRDLAREMIASRTSLYAITYRTLEAICCSGAKEREHLCSAMKSSMQELLQEVYQSGTRIKQIRERYQHLQQLDDFLKDGPAEQSPAAQHKEKAEFVSTALRKIYPPEEGASFLRQYALQQRNSASLGESPLLDNSFGEF